MDAVAVTTDQWTIFGIIGFTLVLFLWGRWRFDLIALLALLVTVVVGLVPAKSAFTGFADPVVVTVATVLVISSAVSRSGFIDWCLKLLSGVIARRNLQIFMLVGMVMGLSAFMNNVGALALFLPVAIALARKSERPASELLMPLSFGSLLGGLVTVIGTPPNLLVSSVRNELLGEPYRMFDFAPVGLGLCVVGVIYLTLAWRLLPRDRNGKASAEDQFSIEDYISEVEVPEDSPWVGQAIMGLETSGDEEFTIAGITRENRRALVPAGFMELRAGDTLLIESDPLTLKKLIDKGKLQLAGSKDIEGEKLTADDIGVVEVVITAGSPLARSTPRRLQLRSRYGVNLLAVKHAQEPQIVERFAQRLIGHTPELTPLKDRTLNEGDVLVLQGNLDQMPQTLAELGCLPLAARNLQLGRGRMAVLPVLIMAACVSLVVAEVLPIAIAFLGGVVAIGLLRILRLNEMYAAIDAPVIVLLAAMIPVSNALQTSGGSDVIAVLVSQGVQGLSGPVTLGLVLTVTMLVTPFLNNAATVLLMAPVAAGIATKLGYNVDPFLMAVAVGASCDFLTPIGHQSNTLVMGPGGYRFGDYWRLGLPLSILVVVVGVPLILMAWPL